MVHSVLSLVVAVNSATRPISITFVNGIPAKYTKAVSMLVTRNSDGLVAPASNRIGLWDNLLSKVYNELAVVASTVLAMSVTSCAAERNWTVWGQVYVKTRSNLGLQRSQNLIYVKANDTIAKTRPQTVDDLVVVLDTLTVS